MEATVRYVTEEGVYIFYICTIYGLYPEVLSYLNIKTQIPYDALISYQVTVINII